ncbi:nodulation protein NfeD [Bacillus aquiflavi]|uniref:Nodulation protein NfeD n=1 Tax=Bacillus aquiflavi TaxID=2672567 RepID=A0A6B3VXI2_9BACI|nr:nodulation protein NfeD [Bacillus aquiflavi]MBA4535876.1 nodulation protein NfeD [Bacillus aquiflavi]NEY80251.1 nodulation protein NfeD [Bacillus aquiflavi]
MRRMITVSSILFAFLLMLLPSYGSAKQEIVYVVPIEDTVEKGLYEFLKRAVKTAEEEGAEAIIFEVHTPGGAVDAAGEIAKLLSNTKLKTIAYINHDALSAGAYISLYADEIYMVPNASIGAAAIIDQEGNTAGKKAESMWLTAMENAAKHSGRDPIYALAMADESIDLPQYRAEKGKLLTLSADQALEVGYTEGIVNNMNDLLKKLGYEKADVRSLDETFAEKLARFITNPIVIPILLSIGSLGLVLELYSPGFGIPGFMGISSLLLFFYGHLIAGLAGYESIILFVIGIGFIIAELFIPGGILGILGLVSIFTSIILAGGNITQMAVSLLIAIGVAILVSTIMLKVFGKRMKFLQRIILTDSTNTESGYVSNRSRLELIGVEGHTLTDLRPSGTVIIDGERIDVVSEGGFIQKNTKVKVVKAEGSRIVVREIADLNKHP